MQLAGVAHAKQLDPCAFILSHLGVLGCAASFLLGSRSLSKYGPCLGLGVVDVLILAARLMPDPLPEHPTPLGDSDIDFQLRQSMVDSESVSVLASALFNTDELPVPPLNEPDAEVLDDNPFVTGVFYVMAPHYQSEIVQMHLRMPSDLQTILTQARRGLNALKLRFSFKMVPTFPQLGADYASLLVVPVWLEVTSMQVIVWDFRALGGPVYAAYC